jgi:ATP-dependent helicase/nuclease subunit A
VTKWTPQQKLAIDTDGRDIFVTASAGTGKTSVLANRCLRLLAAPATNIGIRQMLVLTFTNAAAEQMRERIGNELRKQCQTAPTPHLRWQLMLIDAADIGTVHSFCYKLIREHFYALGVDPAARLIDEDERKLIRSQVLQETIDWAWQQPQMASPLTELLGGRNITGTTNNFLENILAISDFLDGIADRNDWLARAVAANDLLGDAAKALAQREAELVLKRLNLCRQQLLFAITMDQRLTGGHWEERIAEMRLPFIDDAIECVKAGDIVKVGRIIDDFAKTKKGLGTKPKGFSDEDRKLIHDPIESAVKTFIALRKLAVLTPEYKELAASAVSRQSRMLIELVKRFDYLYQDAKKRANSLDFADLEHLAVRLLQDGSEPSSVAVKLRNRYKAVFVDEYQDINNVQNRLLTLLTTARSVFAVGDVKQSIYAFRGAEPNIFLAYLDAAEKSPADALRVDLAGNFRSRKEVLDFVNAIFGRIMTREIAVLDYDERARLTAELPYEPIEGPAVELHLFDTGKAGDDDDDDDTQEPAAIDGSRSRLTKAQLQAAAIARRIHTMVGTGGNSQFSIFDKTSGATRPVEYRDIVILMRSLRRASDFSEVLSLSGVPVHCQSTVGYFAATEITDSLSLLKVLDNPHRDIELAGLLRSPMFGVSDSDLLRIRLASLSSGGSHRVFEVDGEDPVQSTSPSGSQSLDRCHPEKRAADQKPDFCQCVAYYAASGEDAALRERLSQILARLAEWRQLALHAGLAAMLWHAWRTTGYLSFVAGLPKGRQRRANLLDLHSRAVQFAGFAATPGTSLSAFVEFIEKVIDEGGDYKPADVLAPGENAVRIMSVHKSKGLEFPVVFLPEVDRKLIPRDAGGECLFDSRTTLGLGLVDKSRNARLSSMAGQVIAARKLATGLAEEMRVLYVAATRARERLIIMAAQGLDSCRKIVRNGAAVDGALPEWMLASAHNGLDWMLAGLGRHKVLHEALGMPEDDSLLPEPIIDVKIWGADVVKALQMEVESTRKARRSPEITKKPKPDPADASVAKRLADSVNWRYRWQASTLAEAKTSVTELTHHGDEFRVIDCSAAYERLPQSMSGDKRTALDARTLGTAAHLVIQSLDLSLPVTSATVAEVAARLAAAGSLAADVAAAVNTAAIAAFFRTDVGRAVQANAANVLREWPFTFAVPLSEYAAVAPGDSPGERVIVQGIVDLMVRLPEGLIIVDFKTDRVSTQAAPHRAAMYSPQVALYARAAKAILGADSARTWFYFLHCGALVQV